MAAARTVVSARADTTVWPSTTWRRVLWGMGCLPMGLEWAEAIIARALSRPRCYVVSGIRRSASGGRLAHVGLAALGAASPQARASGKAQGQGEKKCNLADHHVISCRAVISSWNVRAVARTARAFWPAAGCAELRQPPQQTHDRRGFGLTCRFDVVACVRGEQMTDETKKSSPEFDQQSVAQAGEPAEPDTAGATGHDAQAFQAILSLVSRESGAWTCAAIRRARCFVRPCVAAGPSTWGRARRSAWRTCA